jgi:hypothetical protein
VVISYVDVFIEVLDESESAKLAALLKDKNRIPSGSITSY